MMYWSVILNVGCRRGLYSIHIAIEHLSTHGLQNKLRKAKWTLTYDCGLAHALRVTLDVNNPPPIHAVMVF